ncbi:hypothetical protein FRC15_000729 [Serendipita sp. 397]|nr:hypothetical protein FRC15_000729 [Serendipita sp. 397]
MHLSSLFALVTVASSATVAWAQQTAYGQCGGQGWTGATTCVSGWTCVYSNQWYSQCLQGTATSTTKTSSSAVVTSTKVFKNPLKNPNGSDPFMVYSNGYYYLMTTTWTNLQLSRGKTLAELKASTPKVIYTDTNTSRCCNVWAPEIHSINGAWYMWVTVSGSIAPFSDAKKTATIPLVRTLEVTSPVKEFMSSKLVEAISGLRPGLMPVESHSQIVMFSLWTQPCSRSTGASTWSTLRPIQENSVSTSPPLQARRQLAMLTY